MKKTVLFGALMLLIGFSATAQKKKSWAPDEKAEHKARMMSDEIELDEEETQRLKEIYADYFNEKQNMRDDRVEDEDRHTQLKESKEERLRELLGEERYEMYQESKADRKKHHKKKHKKHDRKRGDGGGSMQMRAPE